MSHLISGLIYNVVLLFALVTAYDLLFIHKKVKRQKQLTGLFLGLICAAIMLGAWEYQPGLIFDTRSILISLTALYFGPISVGIVVLITVALRIFQGGIGIAPGIATILTTAAVGLIWRYRSKYKLSQLTWFELYKFGIVVHFVMLLCMLTLPFKLAIELLAKITLPVMIIYPTGVMLLGKLISSRFEREELYEQFRLNEEKYRTTLYSIGDALITTDLNGFICEMNYAAEKLTEWKEVDARDKFLGDVFKIINEEDREPELNPFQRVIQEGQTMGLANHTLLISKSGKEIPIADSGSPIFDSQGVLSGVVLIFQDQSKERTMLEKIKQSETSLSDAQVIAKIGNWEFDTLTGENSWSPHMYDLIGFPKRKSPPTLPEFWEFIHPDDRDRIKSMFREFLKFRSAGTSTQEFRCENSSQQPKHFTVMLKWKDTNRTRLIGILQDITSLKKVELELKTSKERFKLALENIPDVVVLYDLALRIKYINSATTPISGLEREDFIGKRDDEIWPKEVYSTYLPSLEETLVSGCPTVVETSLCLSDNSTKYLRISCIPLVDENGLLTEIMGITHDYTEQFESKESLWLFRQLTDHTHDGLEVLDPETGRFLDVNETSCRKHGYSREEYLSKKVFELDSVLTPETFVRLVNELKTKNDVVWNGIHKRKDGSEFPVEVSIALVTLSRSYLVAIVRDVSEQVNANRLLKESEERFRGIFENASIGFYQTTLDGKVQLANPSACRILGYKNLDELRNRVVPNRGYLYASEAEHFIDVIGNKGEIQGYEATWIMKDGTPIEIRESGKIIKNSKGDPLYYEGTFEDISDRKRAKQELAKSREQYRQIVETAAEGIWVTDDKNITTFANKQMLEMLCCSTNDLIGKHILDFVFPEDKERLRKKLIHRQKTERSHYTIRLRRIDGEELWVKISATSLFTSSNEYKGSFGMFTDITEQKRNESERERLSTAIEQTADAIVITDSEGAIQYVNPAFEHITGFKAKDIMGENPRILKSGKHEPEFYEDMWKTITNGQSWQGQITNKKEDGTLFTGEATISPVKNIRGSIVNYVASLRDISNEIQLSEQLQQMMKLESIGRLAGGVAHDFNNMLNVIMLRSEMLLSAVEPDSKLHREIEAILDATNRSANLTRQLLAFARKQTIQPIEINLNETLKEMLKMLNRIIGENIHLKWLPTGELWTIKMDPSQLDQILANLVVNSRDAIDGTGVVTIETNNTTISDIDHSYNPERVPGQYVVLSVSDTGRGMDQATTERIFEPFFTTKKPGEGTGMGLSTVFGVVKQNRGFISVYSELGQGTTFRIHLPRVVEGDKNSRVEDTKMKLQGGSETLLIVEDEESILYITQRMLEELGYKIIVATNPKVAVDIFKKDSDSIDLLITDVIMPEMNGEELAKNLKLIKPKLKCLYVSGYTADIIGEHGVLQAEVNFLQKPFSLTTLALAVREVLNS